jgi:hypothetical protein
VRHIGDRSRRVLTGAFGRCRRLATATTCAVTAVTMAVILWPASALADTYPSVTVDPKLITIAIVVVAVVIVAAIAWFVIRRMRRQRIASSPTNTGGVVGDGSTGESGNAGGADSGAAAEGGSAGGADPGADGDAGDGDGTD